MKVVTKIGFFCTLLVCIFLYSAAAEDVRDITLNLEEIKDNEHAMSLCWIDKDLFILGYGGIYSWNEDEKNLYLYYDLSYAQQYIHQKREPLEYEEKKNWENTIHLLTTDGESLFGIHSYTGTVSQVTNRGLTKIGTIPREILFSEITMDYRDILEVGCWNGQLYVLLGTDDYTNYEKRELYAINFVSNTATLLPIEGIQDFSVSSLGIIITRAENNDGILLYDDTGVSTVSFAIRDKIEEISNLCWNEADKSFVYFKNGIIRKATQTGEVLSKAYLPVQSSRSGNITSCSNSGLYAFADGKYVFIRNVNGSEPTNQCVLRIAGVLSPELLIEFSLQFPDIALLTLSESDAAKNAALSGDELVDIFLLSAPGEYTSMKEKGYISQIDSDELNKWVDTLYPEIQRVTMNGESLVSVPVNMNIESWSVDESTWIEFMDPEYPKTYEEVFQLIENWLMEFASDYPDYVLSDIQQNGLGILIEMFIREYIFQAEMNNEPLTFNSESFRSAMNSILTHIDIFSDEHEQWGMPLLMSYSQGFGVSYNDGNKITMILPPTINEDNEQYLITELELLAIHKKSMNKSVAEQFILWYIDNLNDSIKYKMSPQLNLPIENPNYSARLSELNNELNELLKAREVASNAVDKSSLDDLIDKKERQINGLSAIRWLISPESIDCYRKLATRIKIPDESVFFNYSGLNSIREVINRFCDNGLDHAQLETLIIELDRVAYMTMMENQ